MSMNSNTTRSLKSALWFVVYTAAWLSCALAVASVLTGCHGTLFRVDSRFTPEQEKDIQAAAQVWMNVGAHEIHFAWRQHTDLTDTDNVIVNPGERAAMNVIPEFRDMDAGGGWRSCAVTTHRHPLKGARIVLVPERIVRFKATVAHELGHYYTGSDHAASPDAVMYYASYAEEPIDQDIALLRAEDPDSASRAPLPTADEGESR